MIVSTFVGYLGGGHWGAVAMTAGVFLPAFALTLLGHDLLERLVQQPRLHAFLDGVTAAVVGLIEGREEAVVFHPNYASITILERAGGSLCVSTRGGEADTLIL